MAEQEAPGREKNTIEVTIRHMGQSVTLEFNIHQKLRHVLEKALAEFARQYGLQPPPNASIVLRYGSTDLTELDKSLQDYQIPDQAVLDLLFITRAG